MTVRILIGDVREQLATLPDESVHTVVTSPPYWGLRDYGVSGQIGLEPTPAAYVETMVQVFREVRRVLRDDGTCWVNLGDSYASHPGQRGLDDITGAKQATNAGSRSAPSRDVDSLPAKNMVGIPWRVAFALQADGWYLRQDIIWAKPNPMPESVRDRCTKSHEYLFLLAKSERYYFDADAIAEPSSENTHPRRAGNGGRIPAGWATGTDRAHDELDGNFSKERKLAAVGSGTKNNSSFDDAMAVMPETRNKRSVWTVATAPFKEAHFATFPPALIEPCILAGCPERCCAVCGAPWVRIIERVKYGSKGGDGDPLVEGFTRNKMGGQKEWDSYVGPKTVGVEPSCECGGAVRPGTVLDPFGGAGTSALVADRHGRDAILIELNPAYAEMAKKRIYGDFPLFAEVTT